MSLKNFREGSRNGNWCSTSDTGSLTLEQINCGSLLRIADSLEKMEKPFVSLLSDVKYLQDTNREKTTRIAKLKKSNAAYRGIIKRMKKA